MAKIGRQISVRFCPRLRDKYQLIITNNLAQFVVTEPRKNVYKNGIVYRLSSIVYRLPSGFKYMQVLLTNSDSMKEWLRIKAKGAIRTLW